MQPERFSRLREVVIAVSRLPPEDRAAYLDVECAGDPELRMEVESLLQFDDEETPLARTAGLAHLFPGGIEPATGGSTSTTQQDGHANASVEPGRTISRYRIVEKIGEGAMGLVWRAVDASLGRQVAVKTLPRAVAGDPLRIARFEREARAIGALDHPNILAIHEWGRDGEISFAVTELLEGETLRTRLESGGVPVRKVVDIAGQISRGLAAAHERGIVHRDLKPDNIFLGRDGRAKIVDFGIAALLRPELIDPGSPTFEKLTLPGAVFGTAAYMSPEQARGEPVDHRSDIFSLGVVMYEMLTGANPFERPTASQSMAAIVADDVPDLQEPGSRTPAALERVVRRCLEKRVGERFQSAQDLAFAIENSVTVAALQKPPVMIAAPARVATLTSSGSDCWPSPSPDGRLIAFSSRRDGRARIWIKHLTTRGEQPVTEGSDIMPSFSPDGSTLLFLRAEGGGQTLYRQALVGGQPRRLTADVLEARWSADGRQIAFLRAADGKDGRETVVGVADALSGSERCIGRSSHRLYGIGWSPTGHVFATETVPRGVASDFSLLTVDPKSEVCTRTRFERTRTPVGPAVWTGDPPRLLFARGGSLVGDQGNPVSRVVSYDPETGLEDIAFFAENLFPSTGGSAHFPRIEVVSRGRAVFSTTTIRENLFEHAGATVETAAPLTSGHGRDRQPVCSPDGRHVLFASNRTGNLDLWMLDRTSRTLTQVTDDDAHDWDPYFTPDGQHILWSSNRTGHLEVWMAGLDGSGARQVTDDGLDAENPTMTPDCAWIVYWSSHPEKRGLWKIRTDGTEAMRVAPGQHALPEVSPDGKWVSFLAVEQNRMRNVVRVISLESGRLARFEIIVSAPLDRPENIILGRHRWLPDGRGIAFVGLDAHGRAGLLAQDFEPDSDTAPSRRLLVCSPDERQMESFAVSPDGQSFVVARLETSQRLMIAENLPGVTPVG